MKPRYETQCLPETERPEGQFASGDDAQDAETVAWIWEQLESGNPWAWCTVRVTATVELDGQTFEGEAYLGGCSYESRAAFEAPGGYFDDLKVEAFESLKDALFVARDREHVARKIRKDLKP